MPPKGERRKQQIINTAKEMFIDKGFQSTHIGQVCEKLNIARGTVYQYFSNKKEILYAILESVTEKIEDVLYQDDLMDFLSTNPETRSVIKFVSDRISACISILIDEPIVIKLIFKDIVGIDAEVVERVNTSIMQIRKRISEEIEEYKRRGIFKGALDSDITSSMLIGGIMMLIYEYDKRNMDVLDRAVVESITNNYLNGVLK